MSHFLPEEWLREAVGLLVRLAEAGAALVIFSGVVLAFVGFLRIDFHPAPDAFNAVRLRLARYLALGLEFQLASDLLRTVVAPSFEEIGKLAAVAAIRTGLTWFLARQMREEQPQVEAEAPR